ncbi:MAG: ROK family protein, partial [Acidimicrobiales bacterium]
MAAFAPVPAQPLTTTQAGSPLPDPELVLAVDVGGTKMAAGLVGVDGSLCSASQVPTPPGREAGSVWSALAGLVERVAAASGSGRSVISCGVGCGGPMAADGELVSPLNIPAWRSFPLRRRLSELTGLPTYVDNDAKAFALGEGWRGAAAGRSNFLGMVVSTGVGGGLVVDGRLLDGRVGNAGHVGHVVVEPDGRPCSCGGRG